jgi:hypothetical protein
MPVMPASGYMVYLLIDPRDRVPFYAGMTCRPGQRWNGHRADRASSAYLRVNELINLSLKCRVRLIATDLRYHEARWLEQKTIEAHRPTLLNRQATPRLAKSAEAA